MFGQAIMVSDFIEGYLRCGNLEAHMDPISIVGPNSAGIMKKKKKVKETATADFSHSCSVWFLCDTSSGSHTLCH